MVWTVGEDMTHDWVLCVLNDLKTFAERNSLPILAENLDKTKLYAALELSQIGSVGAETSDANEVKQRMRKEMRDH